MEDPCFITCRGDLRSPFKVTGECLVQHPVKRRGKPMCLPLSDNGQRRKIMGWKFWRNRKRSETEKTLELLKEEIFQINRKFSIIEEHLQESKHKIEVINRDLENNKNAIQKILRLEYKSFREILNKLNQIHETVDYGERYIKIEKEKDCLVRERNFIIEKTIQWLDDIDLIYSGLNKQSREHWVQLLHNWQKQIIKTLGMLKIYEINIMGKTFNHELAEAVNTKEKEADRDYLPYEVIDVLQRGFMLENGTLLRKAKVITIEEKEREKDYEQ